MLGCGLSAQESLSPAQKKYQKEISAVFRDMEIVDLELSVASVGPEDELVPSFKLRNKTTREIPIPFAVGFPSERGGVLGYPVWKFERTDKKGLQPVTRKGALVYAFAFAPSGVVSVGVSGQKRMVAGELQLYPGDYQLSVMFMSFLNYAHESVSSKPIKFTVNKTGERKGGTSQKPATLTRSPSSPGADDFVRKGKDAGNGRTGLLECVRLEGLEIDNAVLKAGVPLAFHFQLARIPGKEIPADEGLADRRGLNCNWMICKTNAARSPKARIKISGSSIGIGSNLQGILREKGVQSFSLQNETRGMEPGYYEVVLFLWREGESGQLTDAGAVTAGFKILR